MKIGVFEFAIDQSEDPAVLAKRAEELGFASFWVPEHPIIPIKTSSPYPASRDGIIPDAWGCMHSDLKAQDDAKDCDFHRG